MNKAEIESLVIEVVQEVVSPIGEKMSVSLDDNFRDDLGGDSLDMVQVVMKLEKKLEISVTDEECECLTASETKIGDIADFIEKRYSQKNE